MRKNILLASLFGMMIPTMALANTPKEIVLDNDSVVQKKISIYNDSLAYVKDIRNVRLPKGESLVSFVGVAASMKPETAVIKADLVDVLEQNYNYNVMTPYNILEEFIGKKVKTVMTNSFTGKDVFADAVLIDSKNGTVLEFDYGIETNFPGRVIVPSIPSNLQKKPTLVATLKNQEFSQKNIELSYLTNGVTWKADYVVNIKDKEKLSIDSFVTINNTSGIDYDKVEISLVSGSVNQVHSALPMPVMRQNRAGKSMEMAVAQDMSVGGGSYVGNEALGDYVVYTVPGKTTIKDNQTKQVKLESYDDVKYFIEYKFASPLHLSFYSGQGEFDKGHPEILYKFDNDKESNLGKPLPKGVVRFYEKDSQKETQFIGEAAIAQLSEKEKAELNLGKASDIFTTGKIIKVVDVSENLKDVDIEVVFTNSKDEKIKLVFEQPIYNGSYISSTIEPKVNSAPNIKWELNIEPKSSQTLTYKIRVRK